LIFATTVLVWAAAYFPTSHEELHQLEARIAPTEARLADLESQMLALSSSTDGSAGTEPLALDSLRQSADATRNELDEMSARYNALSGHLVEVSYLGQAGHAIEPAVRPLGWDWKIGVGVLASFPAREVIIATLGTIYSLGSEVSEDDPGLIGQLREAETPDGSPVFNVAVACSVMVFFALCAQCASTLMVIGRETNSWRWPAFTFAYMTALAYVGALLTYQIGMLLLS